MSDTRRPEWLDRLYIGSTGHGDPATCQTMLDTGGPCRECDERKAVEAIDESLDALRGMVAAYVTVSSVGWPSWHRHFPKAVAQAYRVLFKAEGR